MRASLAWVEADGKPVPTCRECRRVYGSPFFVEAVASANAAGSVVTGKDFIERYHELGHNMDR